MRPSTAVSAPAGAHLPRDHTLCDRPRDVRLALDKREVDVDSNQVARIELVCLRHWQPRSAEIRPVDPSLGSQSRAPYPDSFVLPLESRVEGDWLGHAAHGQIPAHLIVLTHDMLDTNTLERDRGISRHVEDVRRAYTAVALWVSRIDAGGVDRDIDPRVARVELNDVHVAAHSLVLHLNRDSPHLADGEPRVRL